MIRSNVNKLRRLLQQILDFRKVESGNMKLSVSKSDIVSFIDDVCKVNFAPLIRKKSQTFTFSTEDKHLIAYFDRDKISIKLYLIYCPMLVNIQVRVGK